MFINVEETPNPDTYKFLPEKNLSIDKSYIFKSSDNFNNNNFLEQLFEVDGVESVLIDPNFISVTKKNTASWDVLRTILTTKIGSYLEQNNYQINFGGHKKGNSKRKKPLTKIEKQISDLLEKRVKPVVSGHGGEISFHSFKEGIVYLELKGSCAGCPSSTATLKMGIENMLKHYHKEIKEVVEVSKFTS